MTSLLKNLAPPYDSNVSYEKDSYCEYKSEIYVCIEDTTGEFDSSKWQKVFITDFIKGQLNSNLGGKIKSFATYRSDNPQHNYPAYSFYYLKDGTKEININVTSNSGNSFYQVQTPSQIIIDETNLSIGNNKITIPGNYNNVTLVIKNKTSGGQCNYSIE